MAEISLELKEIKKSFTEGEAVLDNISLEISKGEFITLLGSSGCGKTTTLRIIAGLEQPDAGSVWLDGREVTGLEPNQRDVNTVFQNYALFPHMNVAENIGYGLKLKKVPKSEIRKKVSQMLELVQLEGYEKRKPSELSGGQKQRVAIARALVNNPKVLLLDEPLGALDLKLRQDMQYELIRLKNELGITFLYVTHDQEEALTMSDTIVVMNQGYIQQIGTPERIYNEPENAFVADFIGESNIIPSLMLKDRLVQILGVPFACVDEGFGQNKPVDVVIRPEDIDIVPVEQGQLVGTVTSVTFKGMQYDIIVDFRGFKWLIQTTDHSPEGARIGVKIDPDGFHIMKKSEYSGQFGDYSSYSEEYEELADASLETDEEESGDEE